MAACTPRCVPETRSQPSQPLRDCPTVWQARRAWAAPCAVWRPGLLYHQRRRPLRPLCQVRNTSTLQQHKPPGSPCNQGNPQPLACLFCWLLAQAASQFPALSSSTLQPPTCYFCWLLVQAAPEGVPEAAPDLLRDGAWMEDAYDQLAGAAGEWGRGSSRREPGGRTLATSWQVHCAGGKDSAAGGEKADRGGGSWLVPSGDVSTRQVCQGDGRAGQGCSRQSWVSQPPSCCRSCGQDLCAPPAAWPWRQISTPHPAPYPPHPHPALPDRLLRRLAALPPDSKHCVGVAGIPGCGKTLLVREVCRRVNQRRGHEVAVVVPM